jgi:prepilin-type N-terminal cleavage/methylation domain-containing protein
MKQINNSQAGFTLIEVIIAALIIVFGMLAMGTFLGSHVNKNSKNERQTIATMLAQNKIEELRITAMSSAGLSSADDNTDITTTDAGPFTRTWTIDDATILNLITVQVVWTAAAGTGDSEVTLTTQINN